MRMLNLISNKVRCPNRNNKSVELEICKECSWFAGRTRPIRKQIYVKCVLPKELLE